MTHDRATGSKEPTEIENTPASPKLGRTGQQVEITNAVLVSDDALASLAQAVFQEQERMRPEGETWEGVVSNGERAYYENSALAVLRSLRGLRIL